MLFRSSMSARHFFRVGPTSLRNVHTVSYHQSTK